MQTLSHYNNKASYCSDRNNYLTTHSHQKILACIMLQRLQSLADSIPTHNLVSAEKVWMILSLPHTNNSRSRIWYFSYISLKCSVFCGAYLVKWFCMNKVNFNVHHRRAMPNFLCCIHYCQISISNVLPMKDNFNIENENAWFLSAIPPKSS